mgnify:CR=1 FL=1
MPNVKDCPGFETFGADVQQAREAVKMSRRELAEKVGIAPRYLANIERTGCDAAHPHLQAARRTLLQPGAASGGQ